MFALVNYKDLVRAGKHAYNATLKSDGKVIADYNKSLYEEELKALREGPVGTRVFMSNEAGHKVGDSYTELNIKKLAADLFQISSAVL